MRNKGGGIARVNTMLLYDSIRVQMTSRGMTSQAQAAKAMGIDPGALNRLAYGSPPDSHNLAAMLAFLGEDYWWMQGRADT